MNSVLVLQCLLAIHEDDKVKADTILEQLEKERYNTLIILNSRFSKAMHKNDTKYINDHVDNISDEQLCFHDSCGWTILHVAIAYKQTDVAKILLSKMSNEMVVIQNNDGWTALHFAMRYGTIEIVKIILDKMTSEQHIILNKDGKRAIDLASDTIIDKLK